MARGMTVQVPDDDEDLIVTDTNEAPHRREKNELGDNTAGFNELKAQLDDATRRTTTEARRADAAEARSRQAAQYAETARKEVADIRSENVSTRRVAIDNALSAAASRMEGLESEYAAAFEAGDSKTIAAIQRTMSELGGDIAQLKSGKAAIGEDTGTTGRVVRDEPPPRRAEPKTEEERFEAELAARGYTPIVKDWIRQHREVITDETKRNEAMSAHHEALARGYRAETDEYFAYIDRKMGYRSSRAAEDIRRDNPINDDDPDYGRDRPMRSAPARGSNGGGGNRGREVQLTSGEVTNATDGTIVWNVGNKDRQGRVIGKDDPRVGEPIGVEEMARRKRNMDKEGRYAVPSL